jgi:myo-inositol-1(or 4)-monophosphatase
MTESSFQIPILKALHKGGDILLKYFGKVSNIKVKENLSSVVSEADVESEKIIIDLITKDFPDHNIISEESGYIYKGSPVTWIVDPLDGTSNFVAGLPWFGVLIAVMKNYVPMAAGAFIPVGKHMYYAERSAKTRRNGRIIHVADILEVRNALVAYSLDYSDNYNDTLKETGILAKVVNNARNIRSTNCLLDFCYIADGRIGAAVNYHEKIWDIVAPWLIVKQAGGMVTDTAGKELNFTVTLENYKKDFPVIASNGHLHNKLVSLIQDDFNSITGKS